MTIGRLLGATCAVMCIAAFAAESIKDPALCDSSTASCEAEMEPEKAMNLAQTAFGRGKVGYLGQATSMPRQGMSSYGMIMRVILGAMLALSAVFAYAGVPTWSDGPLLSIEQPRRLANAFL